MQWQVTTSKISENQTHLNSKENQTKKLGKWLLQPIFLRKKVCLMKLIDTEFLKMLQKQN